MENHNYSVVIDDSSDDNRFKSCRFDGGGPGGVRPGSVVISGTFCLNNVFTDCKMVDFTGYTEGTFQNLSSTNVYNQLIDCIGFSFNPTYILNWPNIQNHRKAQGSVGNGQQFGALVVPAQGIIANPGEGISPAQISGIGTATATLNAFGVGEAMLGNQITSPTTIATISNMRPGQFLVLSNYQIANAVTVKSSTNGIIGIVLKDRIDAVLSAYSDSITFYCISVGLVVEVGRSLASSASPIVPSVVWTPSFVRSGGSTPAQTSTGRYLQTGKVINFWFKCVLGTANTDSYYDTSFPFLNWDTTSALCGTVQDATTNALFAVEALSANRLRARITSSVTAFSGFGTVLID